MDLLANQEAKELGSSSGLIYSGSLSRPLISARRLPPGLELHGMHLVLDSAIRPGPVSSTPPLFFRAQQVL